MVNELFADYFEREQNIGSIDVLTKAAVRAGLDGDEVRKYLETDQDAEAVNQEVYVT